MTARELAEIISGLRKTAAALREAANGKPVKGENIPQGVVLASAEGLEGQADYLDEVADDLIGLIPPKPIRVEMEEDDDACDESDL